MTDDIEAYRSAKLLIDRYHSKALEHAVDRAAEVKRAGDAEGAAIWLRVIRAIVELTPAEGSSKQ